VAKTKTVFFCTSCGNESPKWVGKCPSCGEWNTYREEEVARSTAVRTALTIKSKPQSISLTSQKKESRFSTHDQELDRVLGGGLVDGSLVLVGGEPGIGKSTLMLQIALKSSNTVLYVSGEESAEQIGMRAGRLNAKDSNCQVLTETNLEQVLHHASALGPRFIIIDSIQTLSSDHVEASAGSVSQLRECTNRLLQFAKHEQIAIFLVGHITKEGMIAGPKVLEHMVDTVLQFEGDRKMTYRILRTLKNRFGSTAEIGIYEMVSDGLQKVDNPSEMLVSTDDETISGSAIAVSMEGNRPLLVEIQALVSSATYGTPQRIATGYDHKRLNMILAVLEKRLKLRFSDKDVFLNVVGGIRIQDPALDLATAAALISSFTERAIPHDICLAGEVGLGGEIRKVARVQERIKEAGKLGYQMIITANYSRENLVNLGLRVEMCKKLSEAFKILFAGKNQ
jgi:DNA repair protein RadA/Sms